MRSTVLWQSSCPLAFTLFGVKLKSLARLTFFRSGYSTKEIDLIVLSDGWMLLLYCRAGSLLPALGPIMNLLSFVLWIEGC